MTWTLNWTANDDGLRFEIAAADGARVPFSEWGGTPISAGARTGSVAPLLTLVEDGTIAPDTDSTLHVPHAVAASWEPIQIRQLGLPDVAPFRIHIKGQGVLTAPNFRFSLQLRDAMSRPILGTHRQGVILNVGTRKFSLLDPIFSLIEAMERFNATPKTDIDRRFEIWGDLQRILPEDAVVDDHLRSLNIARADIFTLDPTTEDTFDPVLLARRRLSPTENELGAESPPEPIFPEAAQRNFAQRFQELSRAQRRYVADGNWYVMVPKALQQALQVVHDVQKEDPVKRRAFLANPHAHLKERLAEHVAPEEIDELFQETPAFLSSRVAHLGVWNPKAQAFVSTGTTPWLPPDHPMDPQDSTVPGPSTRVGPETRIQVPIGDRVISITPKDVPEILDQLHEAQAEGRSTVDWHGQPIPVDEDSFDALRRLAKPAGKEVTGAALVPIILDNLNDLEYRPAQRPAQGPAGGFPGLLKASLLPHQKAGLEWLQEHWANGSPGALLADDMGLGKTVQTLAFLAWVQEGAVATNSPRKPHLIVAPTVLLRNWEAEAERHLAAPGLGRLLRAHGKETAELARRPPLERQAFLRDQIDWVLTTYETLRDKIRLFVDVPWRVVVFDEAQKIKNPASRMTDMAKSLAAECTIALTGTPVENSLSDLWCIVDTVHPGLLGSHAEFKRAYAQPAAHDPDSAAPIKQKLEQDLRPPLLLRRMKEQHLQGLPERHEHPETRTMPAAQADAYDAVVEQAQSAMHGTGDNRGAILEALHGLRKVSLLPEPIGSAGLDNATIRASARLSAMIEILDKVHDKSEKALIFIEFLGVQEALIPYLRQRYKMAWDPARINGSLPAARRQQHVDTFQNRGEDIFDLMLLSPKAAGVGLTLTAANHVVHLSRWWNPAVEDQCTDRVHRIGQTRDVHIYYPTAVHPQHREHSFDLNLHRLLEKKRKLSRAVLAPPAAGDDDLRDLLNATTH